MSGKEVSEALRRRSSLLNSSHFVRIATLLGQYFVKVSKCKRRCRQGHFKEAICKKGK
jgi:hypothetical protein